MPQAEFGDRAPGRVDHPSRRGGAAAKRLQHGLAPRRRRLDRGRVGRDAKQPHHVKTPPARARNRVGSPQRRKWRIRQHGVHPAVFTRASRRGESVVQGDFAVADSPEAGQAPGADGVRLGFPGSVVQFGQLLGGRAHRGLDLVQSLGMDQHRELAVEACRPCRESSRIACRCLQLRDRACSPKPHHPRRAAPRSARPAVRRSGRRGRAARRRVPRARAGRGRRGRPRLRRRGGPSPGPRHACSTRRPWPRCPPTRIRSSGGQFGQQLVVGAGLGLQRRGDALVQPHAPHGCQLGEQRLSDDRVVEPVATAGLFDDDAGLARFVERVDEVLVDHPLDQVERRTGCRRPRPPRGPCSSPPEVEKVGGSRLLEPPAAGCSDPNGRRFRPRGARPR